MIDILALPVLQIPASAPLLPLLRACLHLPIQVRHYAVYYSKTEMRAFAIVHPFLAAGSYPVRLSGAAKHRLRQVLYLH